MIKRNMTVPGNIVAAAVFLALLSSPSCQTRPNLVVHQTDALLIILRETPAGYPSLEPYNHPYAIQATRTFNILESLAYEAGSLLPLSRGQQHHVFTRHQVERLGPAVSEALGRASPQDVVAFSVADAEKPDRRTKGLVFILGDELHLIIEELRKPLYQGEQKPYQQQVPRWELLPGDNQRHYASRPEGKGAIVNWIITPLR